MAANHAIGQPDSPVPRSAGLLVGRAREQNFLREELAVAFGGRGRLVLLGGEAGIGKTTLARDLAGEAATRGARVLTGHCYDLTNAPPYGPWLDLAAGYDLDPALPPPPAAFAGGRLDRVTDQAALFAEVRRFFAELGAVCPVLVVLEDLHWTDPASLELLRHVGPHLLQWPILLLVTYRVDELTRRNPFYQQLPALVREADGVRLDLRRLDADALGVLVAVRYRLTTRDEARLVAYLDRHAEGNPFFTIELLRALQEEGLLRRGYDRSSLGELARVVVPPLLRQVIDARVARLGEATRQRLTIAAMIGQEVPLDLWAEAADLDEESVLTIVEHAVEAHLVEAEPDGTRIRFVHALTREALYAGILPPRRRIWHRRVAEMLLARAHPDPDAVAYHLQQAADPRAWEWLERAGERAQRAYAWLTAIERFGAAADLLKGVEGHQLTRGRLLVRLARLQRFSDPAGAIAAVDEAGRLATAVDDAILAAEVHFLRGLLRCYSDQLRIGLGEMVAGIEAFEAMPFEATREYHLTEAWLADVLPATASIDVTGDNAAAALLHAAGLHYRRGLQPWYLAFAGQVRQAVAIGERFLSVLGDVPGERRGIAAAAFSSIGLGIAYAGLGRPEQSHRGFARAREILRDFDHHGAISWTALNELRDVALTYGAADPAVRRELAAEGEAALGRAGGALPAGVPPKLAWLGCLVLDGRWAEARRILDGLPLPGNAYLRREVTDTRAVLACHRGEPATAWAQIRPLFPDGPATEPGDICHQEGLFLQRLAADLCREDGDLVTARAWLEAHDRWLAWSESVLGCAEGKVGWARWHHAAGEDGRARVLAAEALQLAAAPDQPLVRLAAHRLLGEIETAAGGFAEAKAHLAVALDLAGACDAPFERALALLAIAGLRLATGESAEAASLLDEVRRICGPLGAAPTLSRADALSGRSAARQPAEAYPAGLTTREVDVLRLLAQGRSNREIADALCISVATVKRHVYQILAKLDQPSRTAAALYATGHGLA
jgi:DNA-binding CsgD family transcriptional regulator